MKKYAFDPDADVIADLTTKYPGVGDLAQIYAQPDGPLVHKWHHYIPIYERYFAPHRNTPVRFLEIGVSNGGSLRMWRNYFGTQATIFGIDINPACINYNGLHGQVRIGSQTDEGFLASVVEEMGGVDVVLDDGSHQMQHIVDTLCFLFPKLTVGGVYMVEDLHTSYWPRWGGGLESEANFFNLIRNLTDDMHHWYHNGRSHMSSVRDMITGIHVHDSIAILERGIAYRPVHSFQGKIIKPRRTETVESLQSIIAEPRGETIAECYGIKVPALPVLGKRMIESLNDGAYERNEILCAIETIPKNARILELGAGVGVVGAVMAHNCKADAILSFEANPNLLPYTRMTHQHNGLEQTIRVELGVVLTRPNAPDTVDFFVRGNFLGSGLQTDGSKKSTKVNVPVFQYDSVRKSFPHSVIMMDIEGGELDFLKHADLSDVNVFIAEFHPRIYGKAGISICQELLEAAGLMHDESSSRGSVKVFLRTLAQR